MQTFIAKIALLLAAAATGTFLRSTGLFNKQDAKAANLAIIYGTLPSLILQTLLTYGFLGWEGAAIGLSALVLNLTVAVAAWYSFRGRRSAERALLTGGAVGAAVGSIAYAFVEAGFGPLGLHFAVLWDLGNLVSVCVLSYLIFGRGGMANPERYVHTDGGVYRGQWQGSKKHGLGIYTYPGGGRYEGCWADNVKDGLGVYYFPKGGWYEGEWRKGERSGLGLRVMSSGVIQAGRWQGLNVVEAREPSECAVAVASAHEVAKAAKRVPVGGGSPADAAIQLLSQPAFWAAAVALISALTGYQIPVMVDLLTAHLATAHIPLAMMVFGLNTDLNLPQGRQVPEVAYSLALRVLLPLALATATALTLSTRYTDAIAIAALCAMGPLSEQVPFYVQLFRLNEAILSRVTTTHRIASFVALMLLTFAMVLATPADAVISRVGLAMALGSVTAILAATWPVAAWLLSNRRPGAQMSAVPFTPAQSLKSKNSSIDRTSKPGEGPAEDIPIGIAWQEQRQEAAGEAQGKRTEVEWSEQGSRNQAEDGMLVNFGYTDTGEGDSVGEASIVSGWDDSGNVLVGSQSEASTESTDEKLDLGETNFEMGGSRPDLDSALQGGSSAAEDQGGSGGEVRKPPHRRRAKGAFQDVEDESDGVCSSAWQDSYGLQETQSGSIDERPQHRHQTRVECMKPRQYHGFRRPMLASPRLKRHHRVYKSPNTAGRQLVGTNAIINKGAGQCGVVLPF